MMTYHFGKPSIVNRYLPYSDYHFLKLELPHLKEIGKHLNVSLKSILNI